MRAAHRRRLLDARLAGNARRQHQQGDGHADDVGALDLGGLERLAAEGDDAVRVRQEGVRAELRQLRGPAHGTVVDLVPEHAAALRLDTQRDEDGQQVHRQVRPGRGLDLLQDVAREGLAHAQRALSARTRPAAFVHDVDAELGESAVDERELLGHRVLHPHITTRDGAEREESDDLVEVFGEGEFAATERAHALDRHTRGANALDARAEQGHEAAEFLHVRL